MYWADGAGSRTIFDSLQELLAELRSIVLSDRAIALYRPTVTTGPAYFVLSDSCSADLELALPNERLSLSHELPLGEPTTVSGVTATSSLRPFRLGMASALVIPWDDPFGRGVVLIGLSDQPTGTESLQRLRSAADHQRLVGILLESRMASTLNLQRQLTGAVREVLAAEDRGVSTIGRLGALVTSARGLFRSDTAYLALPDIPGGANYFFASMDNLHTAPFRSLRMEFGQGLGGLARTQGRVVSSLNYFTDERLQAAPVVETGNEGIVSAMAAPLMRAGSTRGVLYVGSRTPRAFSPTDELMLEEFADYIALMLDQPGFLAATQAAHADRMREDFAHAIHDSVVRSLVQIGFTAEQAARTASDKTDVSSIDMIRKAAEEALKNLREELSGLVSENAEATLELTEILATIVDVPKTAGVDRGVVVLSGAGNLLLPAAVAESLIRVGVEALTNSERHARATSQTVQASVAGPELTVCIIDDGVGSPLLALNSAQLTAMGHLGVAGMHRRVEAVGGSLTIESTVEAGTTVSIRLPIGG
jgi:signal transduction histidine kinase